MDKNTEVVIDLVTQAWNNGIVDYAMRKTQEEKDLVFGCTCGKIEGDIPTIAHQIDAYYQKLSETEAYFKGREDGLMMGKAQQSKLEEVEMCKHYDPQHTYRCHQGLRGGLKCHSKREDCDFYEPSLFKPKPSESRLLADKELVEKCMPTLERFEEVEKQVFYPIPKPPEFSATIRIYASTMSREAVRKTLNKTASIKGTNAIDYLKGYTEAEAKCQARVERIKRRLREYEGVEVEGYEFHIMITAKEWQALWKEGIDG